MRVIGGLYRSRIIKQVQSEKTRETSDKVRGAIFNSISPYLTGNALDLFAGSGAMGIEAISRGINDVYFIDSNVLAIKTINENIKSLNIINATIIKQDYNDFLRFINKNNIKFNVVFLDPPYHMDIIEEICLYIDTNNLLKKNGLIVCEYSSKKNLNIQNYHLIKETIYGIKKVSIYRKEE